MHNPCWVRHALNNIISMPGLPAMEAVGGQAIVDHGAWQQPGCQVLRETVPHLHVLQWPAASS